MHLASCGARDLRSAADVIASARAVRVRLLGTPQAKIAPAPAPAPAPVPIAVPVVALVAPAVVVLVGPAVVLAIAPPAAAAETTWRPPTGARIREVVARHYGVTRSEIEGDSRCGVYVLPRHVGMYLCVRLGGLSLPLTGRLFGDRDHTTVLHAVKRIAERSAKSALLAAEIKTLWERCEAA